MCLYVSRSLFLLTRVLPAFCRPEGEPDTYPEFPREEPLRGSAVVARGAEMWQGPPASHLNQAVAPSQGRGGAAAPPVSRFRGQMFVEPSTGVRLLFAELQREWVCSLFLSADLFPKVSL